jgi:hypothetical protein
MKNSIQKYLLIALTLAIGLPALAQQQQNAEEKKTINQIKKSNQYLYAEVTTEDKQKSIDLADEALDVEINKYVANEKKFRNATQYVARNTSSSWERITLKRGTNMYRAFVYVKKSDIFPADNVRSAKNPQTAKVDNITFNSPGGTVEAERATKPAQPAKAEPAKAQPTAPKVASATTASTSRYDKVVERLKGLTKSSDVAPLVKRMKTEGLISDYNTYKNLPDPSEYVLIVYNKEGAVEALLSDGVERTNLKTGAPDNVGNYKGRGAFGVKVKK